MLHVEEESDTLANWDGALGIAFRWSVPMGEYLGDLCDEAASKLTASLPFSRADQVQTLVAGGKTADEILKVAADHDVDLIVMSASQRSLLTRLFLGSVTDQVLRKATIPVITLSGIARATLHRRRCEESES